VAAWAWLGAPALLVGWAEAVMVTVEAGRLSVDTEVSVTVFCGSVELKVSEVVFVDVCVTVVVMVVVLGPGGVGGAGGGGDGGGWTV
jgi:hypothetical protein